MLVVCQVFQRSQYQGERRAQLVCHVGEEAQSFLVQFLLLLVFAAFQFQRVLQLELVLIVVQQIPYKGRYHQCIYEPCPPCAPEGRLDGDFQPRFACVFPVLAFQFSAQDEGVVTGAQSAEHHVVVVSHVVPLAVHAFHHVRILHLFGQCIVAHGEGQSERVLPVGGGHPSILVGYQQLSLGVAAHGVVGFAGNNLHGGHLLLVVHLHGIEIAYTGGRTEEKGVEGACGGRSRREAAQLPRSQMVIVVGLPCAFHIARDAPIGAHPYAAVAVELQGQHMYVVESAFTADDVNTCQFRGIVDTHQSALGGHPHTVFVVGDSLVDFSREQSAAYRSVTEGVLCQVVAEDTASERGYNKVAVVDPDETGCRCPNHLAHGLLSFHLSLAVAINAVFAANPHTAVSFFGKGMHIRLFRLDGNRLEPSRCPVEAHHALVVYANPHMP